MNKNKLFFSDLFTQFDFETFSNEDIIDEGIKLEYIKEMISYAKSDKQAVSMYLGFALAVIGFLLGGSVAFLTNINTLQLIIFYVGVGLLSVSAIFFFTYWRKIHKYHGSIISCIPTLNIERTKRLWVTLWGENKRYFKLGLLLLTLGIILLFMLLIIVRM